MELLKRIILLEARIGATGQTVEEYREQSHSLWEAISDELGSGLIDMDEAEQLDNEMTLRIDNKIARLAMKEKRKEIK